MKTFKFIIWPESKWKFALSTWNADTWQMPSQTGLLSLHRSIYYICPFLFNHVSSVLYSTNFQLKIQSTHTKCHFRNAIQGKRRLRELRADHGIWHFLTDSQETQSFYWLHTCVSHVHFPITFVYLISIYTYIYIYLVHGHQHWGEVGR